MRHLYQGKFNNHGQIIEEWVRAENKEQAYVLLTARLGVTLGKTAYSIRQYFAEDKGRCEITLIEGGDESGRSV